MTASAERNRNSRQQILIATAATVPIALPWALILQPLAPLIVAVGAFCLAFSIVSPTPVSLLFVSFSYFRIHEAYPFLYEFRLPFLLATLTTVSLVWNIFVSGAIKPFWTAELRLLALLFLIVTAGVAFAMDRRLAFEYWSGTYWKIVLMAFAIAWLTRTERDIVRMARVIIAGGILIAAVAIYNKWTGIGLVEQTRVGVGRELGSALADPNDLALILLLPLGIAGALIRRSNRRDTVLALVGLSTTLLAIVFTQSRGGLLGVLIVAAVLGSPLVRSKTLACVLALALAAGLYAAMDISGRVSGGAEEEGLGESAQSRLETWDAALQMTAEYPVTGIGIFNYAHALHRFLPKHSQVAHSTWLGVMAETGVPGLLVFVAMFAAAARSAARGARGLARGGAPPVAAVALGLLASLAGFAVSGTFLSHGFTVPVYVLIGLSAAIGRYADERASVQMPRAS